MKTSLNVVYVLAFPMIFGLIAISDVFVPLFFGAGYERVSLLIKVTVPIVLFIGMTNVLGNQYLLPIRRQNEYTISVWCGAVVNATFNLILIPHFGALGAAIGTLVAEFFVLLAQIFFVRKNFTLREIMSSSLKYFLGALIMFVSVCLLDLAMQNVAPMLNLFSRMFAGVLIYAVFLLMTKDEFICSIALRFAGVLKKRMRF